MDSNIQKFFKAIVEIDSLDKCDQFFNDVATKREIHSMAQRYAVANLLRKRKTYQEIEAEIGVSTATISRVNKSLQANTTGYKDLLKELMGSSK